MIFTASLFTALLAFTAVQAATPKCTTLESGALSTNNFHDAASNVIRRLYAFNSRNEVAYYKTGTRPKIMVQFQTCTPNYAQVPIQPDGFSRYFGRFYLPSSGQCLAVSNPSGALPYYLVSKPCPALKDMASQNSIPFNFVGYQNDEINYQWYGATIPSKKKYQGPKPGATNCQGSYNVNATDAVNGHKYPGFGEPSTSGSSTELNRVRFYCPRAKGGAYVSAFQNFILSYA
ncbi:hypothetical protein BDV93DRAFT_561450 [Ceratobasidium sp. AG-I]|nr:hypothetical protein BDV93DRAFT_561450 [Ceratobasidium sp. AG-I]